MGLRLDEWITSKCYHYSRKIYGRITGAQKVSFIEPERMLRMLIKHIGESDKVRYIAIWDLWKGIILLS